MDVFTSDISGKSFPSHEKISGSDIRAYILDEIKKEHPGFTANSSAAWSEINIYRSRYIENSIVNSIGTLSSVEQQVVKALHSNETISNRLKEEDENEPASYGQKLADKVASFGGSWKFIIIFALFILVWMVINIIWLASKAFDPYPFILLNLILSCLAALQAPVIMMSQNRQEEKDRERSKNDYMINLKSELEIRLLHEKIDNLIINQQERLMQIQQVQIDMMNEILERIEKN